MRLVGMAVAAVVGLGLLAGCSTGGTANETLPPSASSPAETSAALPPLGPPDLPMPDEAREQTAEGAADFTGYYISLINRTSADMDSRYLRQLAKSCETCERIASETDSDSTAGYRYQGGELVLESEVKAAITAPGQAEAAFLVDQKPLEVVDQMGTPVPDLSFPAIDNLSSGAVATWSEDLHSWVIDELTLG